MQTQRRTVRAPASPRGGAPAVPTARSGSAGARRTLPYTVHGSALTLQPLMSASIALLMTCHSRHIAVTSCFSQDATGFVMDIRVRT